ncbi:MAG: ABC transporter ATP-binding protein [bacterium]|nr:ABC transporter ATP-binding protein [bacterium]
MSAIITVSNLVKRYKKAENNAIDGVSFEVEEGEFFSLLGPNGAGKTTTISILTTTLSKTSGEASVAGYDLDTQAADVRRRVGIIFQNPSLDQNLTAEENIRMHAVLYGMESFAPTFKGMTEGYKKRVYELAEILNLKKEIFKPIKTFSGGMKRKLEIIRSLMHHPKVLFLDEPTVGLDPMARASLWEYLKDVRKQEKTTVFLTTHYLDEVEDCDRVCIINKGKVVKLGTPYSIKHDLTTEYIVVDADDRLKLRIEVEAIGLKLSEEGPFHIHLNGHTSQQVIQAIHVPLSVLRIHSPSLEEAYLNIVEEKQ